MDMSRACLIPARGGSQGIPHKNLVDLCGHPLVWWTIMQARSANVGHVLVLSDDQGILDLGRRCDVWTLREPPHIASDTASLEDAITFTLSLLPVDELLILQPSSPLKLAPHIQHAAHNLQSAPSVVSVVPSHRCVWNPPIPRWPQDEHGRRLLRQDWPETVMENGAIYGVNRLVYHGDHFIPPIAFLTMPEWTQYEIDTPNDLDAVRGVLSARLTNGSDGIWT